MKTPGTRTYLWLFWTLAVIGLTADQASKYGIFTWLYSDGTPREDQTFLGAFTIVTKTDDRHLTPREPYATRELKLVPGVFDIVASHTQQPNEGSGPAAWLREVSGERLPYVNRGALFGWGGGQNGGDDLNAIFGIVSFLAAAGMAYWSTRPNTRRDRVLCASLGLILAGTLGNLYDRLVFSGVRDFLHWYKWYDWPVFNIADCCLVCGAGLLLAHAFLVAEDKAAADSPSATASAPAPAESALEQTAARTVTPANG